MKCYIVSLAFIQLPILVNTAFLSVIITLPSPSISNISKTLALALPLAQIFAFFPSALLVAILSIAQVNNWRLYAPWLGAGLGGVLYVLIGVFPIVQRSWDGVPINFIAALSFNGIVGAFYGLSIGLALKWAGSFAVCRAK